MPIIFQDYTMELSIIQDKKDFPSMTATDIIVAICGAVLLTFMHMSLLKSDESIDDTTPDTDSNVITTTTTTTTTVTEAVITTTKRHRPKVAHQMVEEVVEPEIEPDVDVEVEESEVELEPDVEELAAEPVMQTGQTGGTICDFFFFDGVVESVGVASIASSTFEQQSINSVSKIAFTSSRKSLSAVW